MDGRTIKIKIDLPFFKAELKGDPDRHIAELRKLISEVGRFSLSHIESEAIEELMPDISSAFPVWKLSKELQKNSKLMDRLLGFSQVEDVLVRKCSMDNTNEVSESKMLSGVSLSEVKKALSKIFFGIDLNKVGFALAHAMGDLRDDDFAVIFDQIKKALPCAKVEIARTKRDLMGKTLIECVLFGELPEEKVE